MFKHPGTGSSSCCLAGRSLPLLFLLLLLPFFVSGEAGLSGRPNSPRIAIRNITWDGYHKTKKTFLQSHISLQPGDTLGLDEVLIRLHQASDELLNTGLFLEVNGTISAIHTDYGDSSYVSFHFQVLERWYTLLMPAMDIYDRNFNSWFVTHHHEWDRLQYGLRFSRNNLGGNGGILRLQAMLGFSQRFGASVELPGLGHHPKTGFSAGLMYTRNKNVTYSLPDHEEAVYFSPSTFGRQMLSAQAALLIRHGLHLQQTLQAGWQYVQISDSLHALNPGYLSDSLHLRESALSLSYQITYDTRNIRSYPDYGTLLQGGVSRIGLLPGEAPRSWKMQWAAARYFRPLHHFYFSTLLRGLACWPGRTGFMYNPALGYHDDYLSGYEYLVIQGSAWMTWKNELRYKLCQMQLATLPLGKYKPPTLPLAIYLKTYAEYGAVMDASYAGHSTDPLVDQLLAGYGFGIDFVTLYDTSVRVEYSIRKSGEAGLYLHFSSFF